MSTYVCENCGKEFARTSKSKICPECRLEASRRLDKKVKALHEAGTTYAEAQKAETLANIPKIEVPEHLLRVETPEAPKVIAAERLEIDPATAAWYFARAVMDLPTELGDRLLALDYKDAVKEAKAIRNILSTALGIR